MRLFAYLPPLFAFLSISVSPCAYTTAKEKNYAKIFVVLVAFWVYV